MSFSSDRTRRVTAALAGADNILRQQGEWGLQLKCNPSPFGWEQKLVTVSIDGQLVNKSRLDTAPATFQDAWRDMEDNRLLRIAVCYALLFSEETLEQVGGEEGDLLILPVYPLTEREESKSELSSSMEQVPSEAFVDAVEVYVRRMGEADPKGAARLRRAIKAGYLESDPFDFMIECAEVIRADTVSFFWPLQRMPRREDFMDLNGVQAHDKDDKIEAAEAAGTAAGQAVAHALQETLGEATDNIAIRLSEFTTPNFNVNALPSFGRFVVMCIVAAVILCSVVLVFRFLGLR